MDISVTKFDRIIAALTEIREGMKELAPCVAIPEGVRFEWEGRTLLTGDTVNEGQMMCLDITGRESWLVPTDEIMARCSGRVALAEKAYEVLLDKTPDGLTNRDAGLILHMLEYCDR